MKQVLSICNSNIPLESRKLALIEIRQFFLPFSPFGRTGGSHLHRHKGLAAAPYGVALQCLADESLGLVQGMN
jgi:hypothetical protein